MTSKYAAVLLAGPFYATSDDWASLLALSRMGDEAATAHVIEQVEREKDIIVRATLLYKDVGYTRQQRAYDFLRSRLASEQVEQPSAFALPPCEQVERLGDWMERRCNRVERPSAFVETLDAFVRVLYELAQRPRLFVGPPGSLRTAAVRRRRASLRGAPASVRVRRDAVRIGTDALSGRRAALRA